MAMLADHILDARGTNNDVGGCLTSLAAGIERAERFVLADEISKAAYHLIQSKPVSLLDAMPMCRLPFPSIWVEWDGKASEAAGWDQYPTSEPERKSYRPVPRKMGALVESESGGQRGQISWAWMHESGGINVCGLGVNFDWSLGGNVAEWSRRVLHKGLDDGLLRRVHDRWVDEAFVTDEGIIGLMNSRPCWRKLSNDPKQVQAVRGLLRHEAPWFSRHASGVINTILKMDPAVLPQVLSSWEGDICGEAPFITAFVLMLNSRNAVDREPSDLARLNKARRRRGRSEFLSHTVTRLHLSKSRSRHAQAHGMTREMARQHLVMGHFKIRKTGVYWWNPFARGDPARPVQPRHHYETVS